MLKFDGETMPEPQKLEIHKEKIWSQNTGRVDSGDMTGDLVAIKLTLKIQWGILTPEETERIDKHLSKAFFNCTFLDPSAANAQKTKRMYAGGPTYPVYSYAPGLPAYQGVGVDIIEK